jgi:hypothetical protein
MSCLTDYIGLRGCSSDVEPESGLFVNTLPGITMEMIDKSATADQITYRNLWNDVQDEAWNEFAMEFFGAMMDCYTVQPYCDYESLICDNKQKLAVAWRFKLAAKLMCFRYYSNRLNYFTLVTRDDAQELMDNYNSQYVKALKNAMKVIDVRRCHLHCTGGDPKTVTWLP